MYVYVYSFYLFSADKLGTLHNETVVVFHCSYRYQNNIYCNSFSPQPMINPEGAESVMSAMKTAYYDNLQQGVTRLVIHMKKI